VQVVAKPGPLPAEGRRATIRAQEPPLWTQIQMFAQFASGLGSLLRTRPDDAGWRAQIARDLRGREANFLQMLRLGVFAKPLSPYGKLLAHAGIALEDVARAVATTGLEATLQTLFAAGVYVRLDEFKGRRPICRGSLEFEVTSRDFDNTLAPAHLQGQSGGSRSSGTPIRYSLEHYAREMPYDYLLHTMFDNFRRPLAIWRPTPPYLSGLNNVLRHVVLGFQVEKWFSQNRLSLRSRAWRHALLTHYAITASRLYGRPAPGPEHVPLGEAWRVAEWLASKTQAGQPPLLSANAASAVRVCLAAQERGLDIAGTFIRTGSEPLTEGRAAVMHAAGCRVATNYTMGETGRLGVPCARPVAVDDVHLVLDKIALIRSEKTLANGAKVPVNVYTTLLPSTPKLMINVESDDYGVLEERQCGCQLGELGYHLHLHTIRSYEKLTSEGMNFLGADLIRLVEEVLPARFGAAPTDYQFVEEEDANGLPKVSLVVSPRVGPVDEDAAINAVVGFLNHVPGASDNYGEQWRQGGTLRLIRREPYATGASKILALHVTKPKREQSEIDPG
jgi:hypothetical protein